MLMMINRAAKSRNGEVHTVSMEGKVRKLERLGDMDMGKPKREYE